MKNKEPSFSLQEFRNWLEKQTSDTGIVLFNNNSLKPGSQILVRLSKENMINKLQPLNEDKNNFSEICDQLKNNGGKIECISGPNAKIKVLGSNEFIFVPKLFLRRPKKKD